MTKGFANVMLELAVHIDPIQRVQGFRLGSHICDAGTTTISLRVPTSHVTHRQFTLPSLQTDAGVNRKLMTPPDCSTDRSANYQIVQESDRICVNTHAI